MINLEFCNKYGEEERREIVHEFADLNLRNRKKLDDLDAWCEDYLSKIDSKFISYRAVVEATPDELERIKESLDKKTYIQLITDKLYDDVIDDDGNRIMESPGSLYKKRGNSYVIDTLYKNMRPEAKKLLLKMLDTRVCPYCNRNYVFSREKVTTCQLDHFYPKSRYTILAASFYNLIPCCSTCNMKKKDAIFKINPHDTSNKTDDILRFSYDISNADYLVNADSIDVKAESLDVRYTDQLSVLELNDIYKMHNIDVHDVLVKRKIFSEQYIDMLRRTFPGVFQTTTSVEELLYGITLIDNEMGKRPLTKLIRDVMKQI